MTKIGDTSRALTPAEGWYLAFVMFLAYVVGQIDRLVMMMLAPQMKQSLLFSDEQLGLLMGLAFAATYPLGALLFANVAPRVGRKRMLFIAVFMWSVLTMSCTLLEDFSTLVVVRLGVGLFEGCLAPGALPMVAAAFSPERRSMPLAFCLAGAPVGTIIAPILTGSIVSATAGQVFGPFPLIGTVLGWQSAFLVAGGTGLVVLMLMVATIEPHDGGHGAKHAHTKERALPYFRKHWLFHLAILAAVPFTMAPGFAMLSWLPAFLERTYALNPKDAGAMIGIASVPAAIAGTLLGGLLGQVVARLSDKRRYLDIMLWLGVSASGLMALPMLMPNAIACVVAYAVMLLVMSAYIPLGLIGSQQLVPARYRSHGTAFFVTVQFLAGVGLGSFAVGFLTTRVVGEESLHLAMLLLIALVLPLSSTILLVARRIRHVPDEVEQRDETAETRGGHGDFAQSVSPAE